MTKPYTFLALSKLCIGVTLITVLTSSIDPRSLSDAQALAVYVAALFVMIAVLVSGMQWLSWNESTVPVYLHPPFMISLWSIMLLGVPGLISFYDSEILTAIDYRIGVSYSFAAWGMLLITISLISLWTGYALGLHIMRLSNVTAMFQSAEISRSALIAFYMITVLARILRISIIGIAFRADRGSWGGLINFGQWISYLESGSLLVLAMVSRMTFQHRWSPWWLVAIGTLELLFAFTSGTMKETLWLVLIIALIAGYSGVRLRRYSHHVVVLVLLGVIVVPITQELRLKVSEINTRSPLIVVEATWQAFQASWGQGVDVGWAIFVDKITGRQAEISQNLGAILRQTPSEAPYQGFDQFLAIPAYIVPRAIWQDKPILSRGVWFSITYLNHPDDTVTSSAMTIFGEAYIFAGWMGSLLALFSLGLLLALLFRKTMSLASFPLFLALLPNYLDIEGQFTGMIVELLQRTVVLVLVYWLLIRLSNRMMLKQVVARTYTYGAEPG
jgi:hypothetical protein